MTLTDVIISVYKYRFPQGTLLRHKIDYAGTEAPVYVYFAPKGTATSERKWIGAKLNYDVDGRPTGADVSDDMVTYDDRATATYS
jgi:hypothetical protein